MWTPSPFGIHGCDLQSVLPMIESAANVRKGSGVSFRALAQCFRYARAQQPPNDVDGKLANGLRISLRKVPGTRNHVEPLRNDRSTLRWASVNDARND